MTKKNDLLIDLRVHKLWTKAFDTILKEESPGVIQFSFDCEKNFVSPKVPDQISYYSRHLYTYNFNILTEDRVTLFTLMEHEYKKGSNEISSAVWHCLTESDLAHITPGNVKLTEVIFPVHGHSFLPSDRVFDNTEKILRTIPKFGKVVQLSEDCDVENWKEYACQVLKLPAIKRFITVTGEPDLNSLLKRGKQFAYCAPELVPRGVVLNPANVTDIKNLLASHFDDKWAEDEHC
ncbi:hypothetical protein PR048_028235, partial [Dryococelus australis]